MASSDESLASKPVMVRDASSARSDKSDRSGPKALRETEHHQQRLSRRIVAQASAQSMERDDCDVRTSVPSSTGSEARRSLRCGRRFTLMPKRSARGHLRGTALVHWSRPRCPRACTAAPTRLHLETVDGLPRRSLHPLQIRMTLTKAKEGEYTSSSKV